MKTSVRSSRKIGPSLPTWPTTYPYPGRLREFWYGTSVAIPSSPTLANAQTAFSDSQMAKWQAAGFQYVRAFFSLEDVCPTPGTATLNASVYAGILFMFQQFHEYGMRLVICPRSDGGTVYTGLHNDTTGYNRTWFRAFWTNLIAALKTDLYPKWSGDWVMLEVGNEMGLDVSSGLWSMTTYNAILSDIIPHIRSLAPGFTIVYDLYPYSAANQYSSAAWGGSPAVLLERPADKNTLASLHTYRPGQFTNQGNSDDSETGMKYVYCFDWGMTLAQAQTAINAWTAGGLYNDGSAEGTKAKTQIDWWRANLASEIGSDGFTDANISNFTSGFISWCTTNKVAPIAGEFGNPAAVSTNPISSANCALYTNAVTKYLTSKGIGNCEWIAWWLTDDVTQSSPGTLNFVSSKLTRNLSRVAPL
jgi:hypothetical protein